MKTTDEIIKLYTGKVPQEVEHDIAYFGWDSAEPIVAFFNYADSYRFAADTLYETFLAKATLMSDLDRLGFSICYLYRQSIELSLKYVYMTCKQSETDNQSFLRIGHNLINLWDTLSPLISDFIKDEQVIRHYINEFNKFDPDSMMMRYPVKKDNTPNKGDTKLNIRILAEAAQKLQTILISIGDTIRNQ